MGALPSLRDTFLTKHQSLLWQWRTTSTIRCSLTFFFACSCCIALIFFLFLSSLLSIFFITFCTRLLFCFAMASHLPPTLSTSATTHPELNLLTPLDMLYCILFNENNFVLGISFQIKLCKDSFAFWVFPLHFPNNSVVTTRWYTGKIFLTTS